MKDLQAALDVELSKLGFKAPEVKELNLDGKCRSATAEALAPYVSLEKLSLNNIGLSSLEGFPSLTNLTQLSLADNKISTGLRHLSGMQSLRRLDLTNNRIAKVDELEDIQKLPLETLEVGSCPLEQEDNFFEKLFRLFSSLKVLNGKNKDGEEVEDEDGDEDDDDDDDDEEEEGLQRITQPSDQEDEDDGEDYAEEDDDDEDDEEEDETAAPKPKRQKTGGGDDDDDDDDDDEDDDEDDDDEDDDEDDDDEED